MPNILRINFHLITFTDVMAVIDHWRQNDKTNYITITNPHSVMMCLNDEKMAKVYAHAGLTLPDGIGIILAAGILGYSHNGRVTGPDLMLKCCDKGREKNYRHFFYGGADGIADKLAERLSKKYPGLKVAGTYCPPFRKLTKDEDKQVVDMINAARADILWVGLGAPKQEKWMYDHFGRVNAAAMIGVGAAFDFHSGNVKRAPQWLQKYNLEWAHRLLADPKRMWRRYLVNCPYFISAVLAQRISRVFVKKERSMPNSTQDNSVKTSGVANSSTKKQSVDG